ncbi:peptide-methionine (R)-S-oxide reductase MsrB [Chrysiogenes arsenatis]|uniref:peptide-methionine (R)-S-oxide reductase MsrB n=1 Tax=Chrysiogenes arsenatis TaxID=309797 RepID=UPI0004291B4D|nr:peptide-methionine (R)-S-oxide reductase MsrB [Chrysiogenes arsenatis]
MNGKTQKSHDEWRAQLTPEQYRITREQGTERPFTGATWNTTEKGIYICVCCGNELFYSEHKFDAGCGWPSFWQPSTADNIETRADHSHGMVRTEVVCHRCEAHLGHVFPDGPPPTGVRYCMNSGAMTFVPIKTE